MRNFLQVPQKVHHGLLLISELAERHSDGRPVSLEEIARKAGISQGFLEETAAALRKAGLIVGQRGAAGGYRLKKDPAEITAAQVIEAIEGPLVVMECLGGGSTCPMKRSCSTRNVWRKVQNQVAKTLSELTIAELIKI